MSDVGRRGVKWVKTSAPELESSRDAASGHFAIAKCLQPGLRSGPQAGTPLLSPFESLSRVQNARAF